MRRTITSFSYSATRMTTPLQPIIDLARSLDDQYKRATESTTGLKVGHCSEHQLIFEEVADYQVDWLYHQLEVLGATNMLREEHLSDDRYRVTIYLA